MSIEAVAWVLSTARTQNPTEVAVMVGLANHVDPYGYFAFPSVRKLAEYIKSSKRTVQRTLAELEQRGLIYAGNEWILEMRGIPVNRRPVVWNLMMGPGGTRIPHPDWEEEIISWGVNLTPLGARGDTGVALGVTDATSAPYTEPSIEPSLSRLAPSSPENEGSVQRVSTETAHQPRGKGKLRAVPDSGAPDGSAMVGRRGTTARAVRTRAARETISRPDSGGGLAAEFSQRVSEAGLSGPQAVNGPALARSLTAWMRAEQNPDTPDSIRAMFDAFFAHPGGNQDFPLWRRFLSEAPKLRTAHRRAQPIDWDASFAAEQRQIEIDAANGDIRAQKALTGENMPWTQDWKAKQAQERAEREAKAEAERQRVLEEEQARRRRTSRKFA